MDGVGDGRECCMALFGELLFRWRWFADTMLQVVVVLGEVVWEK